MVISIWRFSHFLLAAISTLFLLLITVSGAILTLEPIGEIVKPYNYSNLDDVFISETISGLKKEYEEVLEIEITPEKHVIASVFSKESKNETIYIDPVSSKKIENVKPQSKFFQTVTNFHRSLFFKGIGRAFVGVISILLCFISITGVFLLAERQGGFKRFFSKVKESTISNRYHVVLGRWFLLPIILIATTGVYLSAERFSIIPKSLINQDFSTINNKLSENNKSIDIFGTIRLSEVKNIIFPFSKDENDYFKLDLYDRELIVHQYSGEILRESPYPMSLLAYRWSFLTHTGQGNIIWSIILLITCLSLLFFMYSGLLMSFKRKNKSKNRITSRWSKDEAEYIILVGSETGSTYVFANAFCMALEKLKKKFHISTLNEYKSYLSATHIIVFTATYGDGDAPSNAKNFEQLFCSIDPINPIKFSVVGFGSLIYPHYCRFASTVDSILNSHKKFKRIQGLVKINEQSQETFLNWIQKWNFKTNMSLRVSLPNDQKKHSKKIKFEVVECSPLNPDNTTLIKLRPYKKISYQSGDLLNITPPKSSIARKYSIAKIKDEIILSIKLIPKGFCSSYLCSLKVGDILYGSISKNIHFHFPKTATKVWCIANGTGISPFLGMLYNNIEIPTVLTWGGRTEASFELYQNLINKSISKGNLKSYQLSLSQGNKKQYVQDQIYEQEEQVAKLLKKGGVFMLCGSISMQNAVFKVLDKITTDRLQKPLSEFENNGQLLTDCY